MLSVLSYGTQCRSDYESEHPYDDFSDYDEEEYDQFDPAEQMPWLYFNPANETCGDYGLESYNDGAYAPDTPSDDYDVSRFSLSSPRSYPSATFIRNQLPRSYPQPIQLPPEGSKFNTMKEHLADIEKQVTIHYANLATLKTLAEEAVAEKHRRFMAKLPTEPAIKTHRRRYMVVLEQFKHTCAAKIIQKKLYRPNKRWFQFRSWKASKKERHDEWVQTKEKKDAQGNVWGHRRNGGKKKKQDEAAPITAEWKKEAAARRRERRETANELKKKEQAAKEEKLAMLSVRVAQRVADGEIAPIKVSLYATKPSYDAPVVAKPVATEPVATESVEETRIQKIQKILREKMDYERDIVQQNLLKKEQLEKEQLEKQKEHDEYMEEIYQLSRMKDSRSVSRPSSAPIFPQPILVKKTFKASSSAESADWVTVGATSKPLDLTLCMATTTAEEKRSISQNALLKLNVPKKSTRMCRSVTEKTECKHGAKCRFAHSIAELKITNCSWGSKCLLTKTQNGKCVNCDPTKKCLFRHSGETDDDFYIRNGYKSAPVVKPVAVAVSKPFTPAPAPVSNPWKKVEEDKKPRASRWGPPLDKEAVERNKEKLRELERVAVEEDKKPRASRWGPPKEEKVTVIRAPKEIIMNLYAIALKAGRKNIRIEITK